MCREKGKGSKYLDSYQDGMCLASDTDYHRTLLYRLGRILDLENAPLRGAVDT